MTRKATPFARHPLPSPGSPVCVCLGAGQLRGAGGRGAGCAGLRPFLSSGGSLWGCASGEGCWLPRSARARAGRKHGSLGAREPSGTWAHFTPSPVIFHLQPHPSGLSDAQREPAPSPRALAHSSLHAAGAGEGRPHTALGAVPWGSGAPGSLSPAPRAGFVPQCWGCCARSFPNVSEILLVATASVPAEVEQERLQMGVIQDLHQASESCRAGDLG